LFAEVLPFVVGQISRDSTTAARHPLKTLDAMAPTCITCAER